ncbi:MAG: AAA family ATPase [Terriglobales bacterium]
MIKKIKQIKSVGRFVNYGASGDVDLKRYNLVFGENGRGKTTLCAILRSLQSGDPAHINGRKTLGGTDVPEITILMDDGGHAIFNNGAWNRTVPEIAIFDAMFVSENVHSGDVVDIEHRRSLYSVIVGEQGVKLAKQVDDLDEKVRSKSTEIREKAAALQVHASGMSVEEFLDVQHNAAIDDEISAKEKELDSARQSAQIKARAALSPLTIPNFPRTGLETLLGKTVEGVAADAERQLSEQIRTHGMHDRGQAWLSEGLGYVHENTCPFCNQSLEGASELIGAYKAFFSKAYNELRGTIAAMRTQINTTLDEREVFKIDRTIDQNTASVEFWSRFCEFTPPAWKGTGTGDTLHSLRQASLSLLERKAAAPLEKVVSDSAFGEALVAFESMQKSVTAYNKDAAAANAMIDAKKAAVGAADTVAIDKTLARLRAIKKRHDPSMNQACTDYSGAVADKKQFEDSKTALRAQLDKHTGDVIDQYQQTINQLLADFQAGFSITGTSHDYRGGVPSSNYQILINNTRVELGDSKTPFNEPSFRNTLSAGDRSTLALAFFLAQLAHDSGRANKIVVFDDPFNSQDGFRKDCTIQKIKKCGQECGQVIVLSHDPYFLKRVWDRLYTPADRKCLEMARIGKTNTTICEWDVEKATQDHYKADRNALTNYYVASEGQPRDVVQKIRPVLETYSKNLGGGTLTESDTLGSIVVKIRNAGAGHQLFPLCDDLEELNEYTKRYHHGENPQAAIEPISDTELQGYVRRALEMTGGC